MDTLQSRGGDTQYFFSMGNEAVDRLRLMCAALPEVEERLSHGEPTWFIRGKKSFAMFANHHHDDRVAVWCAASAGTQEGLIASDPTRFFRPPYVGPRGWVGIWLDVEQDWEEVQDLIEEAYLTVAPAKLAAILKTEGRTNRPQ